MVRTSRVLTVLLLAGLVIGCGEERVAHFGAVLPLTGDWAIYGEPIRKGLELAAEELQEEHAQKSFPQRVEVDLRDSESRPERAAEVLAALLDSGVQAVIGGVTSLEALQMIEVLEREEKYMLSPSASSPSLSGASRYFYRIYPSDSVEGTRLGSFAALKLNLDTVVILAANNAFARSIGGVFTTEFERYDGKVPEEVVYPEGTTDFSRFVRQAISHDPQAVFLADFAEPVRRLLAELARQGFEGRVLTTSAFASPDVIAEAGADAERVVLAQTVFDPESEEPKVKAFVEAFRAKYGETPGLFAALGYDAMRVVAKAATLEQSGLPSEFWKGLRGLGDFEGVTGVVQFDQKGDVGKFPRVYMVQNGRLIDYERFLEVEKERIRRERERIFREMERLRRQRGQTGEP